MLDLILEWAQKVIIVNKQLESLIIRDILSGTIKALLMSFMYSDFDIGGLLNYLEQN